MAFAPFSRRRLGVAGCFLHELYAAGEAKFGVDVGEVGLHGARRHEKPCRDVVVGQTLACRKPLRVKVVRTYPHTFPELREVQGQRGFPELEAIGCRPTM